MEVDNEHSGVRIGNVGGSLRGNIIAGGNVSSASIIDGDQPHSADTPPSVGELQALLNEIHDAIGSLRTHQEALHATSPAADMAVQGAALVVRDASGSLRPEAESEKVTSLGVRLGEATALLTGVLNGATALSQKAGQLGAAAGPLVDGLQPLIEKLTTAASWIVQLWPN